MHRKEKVLTCLKEEVKPLYLDYLSGQNHVSEKQILDKLDTYFDDIFLAIELGKLTGNIPEIDNSQAKAWMHAFYLEEAKRLLDMAYTKKRDDYIEKFFQLYEYNQKKAIIDDNAIVYASTGRNNKDLRLLIWGEAYGLFDHIVHFQGIGKYLGYYFADYMSPSKCLQAFWADILAECIQKYSPERRKSFVDYALWIYKTRLPDLVKKEVSVHGVEVPVDTIGNWAENGWSDVEVHDFQNNRKQNNKTTDLYGNIRNIQDEDAAILFFNHYMGKIMSLVIRFYEKSGKKMMADKLRKADYYRFFFTEGIIVSLEICADTNVNPEELENEIEIIDTIDQSLLDYLETDICRSFELIMNTPLKRYMDILEDGNSKIITIPVHEEIYTRYINDILVLPRSQNVVAASLSKYRKQYQELIKVIQNE